MIKEYPGYLAIRDFYGDRRTARSGVPLINHINEGIEILRRLGSDEVVMEAYAVHPLFQSDVDLAHNFALADDLHPLIVLYAMEYRNTANAFLSGKVYLDRGEPALRHQIKLSPLVAVNEMLTADKVQNRKDFITYHQATHERSRELTYYFDKWLAALGIDESRYQELIEGL